MLKCVLDIPMYTCWRRQRECQRLSLTLGHCRSHIRTHIHDQTQMVMDDP